VRYSFINDKPNILVVGDLMLDKYLWGSADRISPEAPVPVVAVKKETQSLGGAGNVIHNLLALGATVSVASILGDDSVADEIMQALVSAGAKTSGIFKQPNRLTSLKTRVMATHNQIVRFDTESTDDICENSSGQILNYAKESIAKFDALLLSDYKKGVLTNCVTKELIALAKNAGIPVLCDPKGADYSKYYGATLLTPNKKEAELATGIKISDEAGLIRAGDELKTKLNLTHSIITLSEDGIGIFDNAKITRIPTFAREVYDVTGAGDTVLAALGFALACRADILDACHFANKAAAVVCGKLGSATASMDEILAFDRQKSKLVLIDEIKNLSQKLKQDGKLVVFTNGCFDILHSGHTKYLQKAREFGDVLILGLNSDASVKRLKGDSRPINSQSDRADVLSALSCVDYIVIFDEDTPKELIETIVPNVLIKGADYTIDNIVGADCVLKNGGVVHTVELVDGKSTSNVISKISNISTRA
jgi:D-beta-D-heptose 7-phosphate kinase/D-beta-D-heptose 1-phosphate adenosyltransferase